MIRTPSRAEISPGAEVVGGARIATLLDVTGRARATLNAGWHRAGHQEIEWNGRDDAGRELPAGVYFARPADHAEGVRLVKVR